MNAGGHWSHTLARVAPTGPIGASRQFSLETLLGVFLKDRSPNTLRSYRLDLEDFARFLSRGFGLPTTPKDALRVFFGQGAGSANELVIHYKADLSSRGFAPGTINRRLATLRSVSRFGRMIGMVPWCIEVPGTPVETVRDTRGPSVVNAARLLAHLADLGTPQATRDLAAVRLMLDLGLRVAEVVGIDVADIDHVDRGIWVKSKGRRSKERLNVPAVTYDAIAGWLAIRGRTEGPLFTRLRGGAYGAPGGRLETRSVYRQVRYYGAALGFRLHPHALRHTAITVAVEQARQHDIGIDEVRQFSRHKTIQTLLIYRDETRQVQGTIAGLVSSELATVPIPDASRREVE